MNSVASPQANETGRSIPNILVLDSGIGGLSVCQSVLASRVVCRIIYVADDAAFPYGTKSTASLSERLTDLVAYFLDFMTIDLVVLACNTVSTALLPMLRERFDVPFVGVVPAIKPAAFLSKNKILGLLATEATISRNYTDDLIADFASDCRVVKVGSSELVEFAEKFLKNAEIDSSVLKRILAPFMGLNADPQPDTIVLGCTHFPFLKKSMADLMPGVQWVDSGDAVARRVGSLLANGGPAEANKLDIEHQIFFTRNVPDTSGFKYTLSRLGFKRVKVSLKP